MKYSLLSFLFGWLLLALPMLAASQNAGSSQPTDSTVAFNVFGVCEMCKQRIEEATKGKGVTAAFWNIDKKVLTLTYNPKRVTLKKINNRIAAAGYDTQDQKADDKDYRNLPDCCRYREFSSMEEMHEKHNNEQAKLLVPPAATDSTTKTAQQIPHTINTISGVVLEQGQNGRLQPLQGASVIWLGTQWGTATDTAGVFNIAPVNGENRLVVSFSGYQSDTVSVTGAGYLKVILSTGKSLHEIRVTAGGRPSTYIAAYDPLRTTIITQKELKKAACCNLSESFETNPSVDVSSNDAVTGSKQIQLLGLSGNYTQLTVENLPGPRGLATPLGLNFIPGTWIESIQLVKGTGSVANGFESIAGQINVELKKPVTNERIYANVYVNDFGKTDLNLNLTQKLGKNWSTTLLLHDAFLNNKRIDENKDGFRDLPTGNLFSVVNRWSFENNKGFTAHVGIKYLADNKTGGQTSFDPQKHKLTTDVYGLQMQTARAEVFGKLGYVFTGKPHKSIGLQLSAFQHTQDAYFGLTTYDGEQKNIYSNLIYQSHIGSDKHKFRTGVSLVHDRFDEQFNAKTYKRKEIVSGGFFEYTFSPSQRFDVVAGIREDYNNLYGWFTTPRLNIRYQPFSSTIIRASIGRGQRTANIFAENNSVFASARKVVILSSSTNGAYGLNPEVAWNKGVSVDQKFRLFQRAANLSAEFFRNDFQNQLIVDLENPLAVSFYNLQGKSFANSFQTEFSFEPVRKFNIRLAYRYFDVKATYGDKLLQKPFTAAHRGFANLAYERSDWKFDYTVSFSGRKRIPSSTGLPEVYKRNDYSPAYTIMNAQISKTFGKSRNIDLYVGGENLTNFFQPDVITAADQPFGQYFDASQIWGPVNGRMLYAGFRFIIK